MIGQGSGFFISPDGYLVTNNHVVAEAETITVVLGDGSSFPGRVIGTDPLTDLALMKVDADRTFPYVQFSDQEPKIGQWVLAVGNPYGLGGTVTLGIVSALGRNIGAGPYDDFMQIDAVVNPGNSGGPSFNTDGEVIGVNSAIFSPTGASVGIGFAIPAYIAADVIADLQDDGVVERGWIGVQIQPVDRNIAAALNLPDDTRGALVAGVLEGAPGAAAGLQEADVITEVDGTPVADDRELARTIAAHDPGDHVTLTVVRDGEEIAIEVTLAQLPDENANAAQEQQQAPQQQQEHAVQGIGLTVAPANEVGASETGLVVVSVDPNGLAATTPLRQGFIILQANGMTIQTPDDLAQAINAAREADEAAILLRVDTGNGQGYIGLPLVAEQN